ncbi:hypothetical protein ABEB36_000583 [Hypothenemus hampei]|uniref:Indole-3-acetaldehyde oxidase n=1 Tax=Hypothenemus hampei TaxID=57062 RepID=A0ABD1FBP8_HYPHA
MEIIAERRSTEIKLSVGNTEYTVPTNDVTPETTLNAYLRDNLHLTATKKMCLEGGCGTCIVAVEEQNSSGQKTVFAVNSCLVSIFSCHGWKILTNEGIGNPLIGFHKIQKLLASSNGSQCGFCSSGMVMSMYALEESGGRTKEEIENDFGGNLCRCTGYRPILTGFRQLATDSDDILDIDDLEDFTGCTKEKCENYCTKPCSRTPICFNLQGSRWMKVYNLADLLEILQSSENNRYMLVAGNTARGVYWLTEETTPELYIDVTGVLELTGYQVNDTSVLLGANISLTTAMNIFRKIAKHNPHFIYLDAMAAHIDLVAHVPVRNIGTIAGNLMTKHQHNEFPSDLFLILETVNATLVIVDVDANEIRVNPEAFLKVDMNKKVIKEIVLRPYDQEYEYRSFKIMQRAQNSHAMVNAGFLFQLKNQGIVQSVRIVYGAINPQFIHATKTEKFLIGKQLFNNITLQATFQTLDSELAPDWVLPDPSPGFRKQLAINLMYKCILDLAPASLVSPRNKSGATPLIRPVSQASQQIYPQKELYPLTQPIQKLEALNQTSGQAEYILDIPDLPGQLHSCFVKAEASPGSVITNIDTSKALQLPGVVAFYSARDIPGINSMTVESLAQRIPEEVFCSGTIRYYYQPVGIIVANTHALAKSAALKVVISTTPPIRRPVLSVAQVLAENLTDRVTHLTSFVPKRKDNDIKKVINGNSLSNTQYHYHMENQNCLVVPTEDGLNVYPGSQWMDYTQGVISQFLALPSQKINIVVRRLGGAFGAKITRNAFLAASVSLAAFKLRKPVRMWMTINDNMDVIGKRFPLYSTYEVGVNGKGIIQYLKAQLYRDEGILSNEPTDDLMVNQFQNCYKVDTWTFDTYTVVTDKASKCFMRAPGNFEALSAIESIMDHIAYSLNLDPWAVRRANMDDQKHPILVQLVNEIVQTTEVDKRKSAIEAYNRDNRWKKRGISVIPMHYLMEVIGNFTTLVSIYHLDGGVAIHHAGIEIGQGINTKVAQVCAYKLGIPLSKVSIKPSYNLPSANSSVTGGSLTSEAVVYSLLKACDVLLARMKPIKDNNPKATWEELVQLCFNNNICLSTNGFYSENEPGIQEYPIYGAGVLELEVDILTGKSEILRVDLLEDIGQSMSPAVDIGQLEGAFILGLGAHTSEELIFDSSNGRLTNDRTWNYKPPGFKDIPQVFNVRFLRDSYNPVGVLRSKAIAEPPTCLSYIFPSAMRNALASARREASSQAFPWYTVDGPTSVENVLLNTLDNFRQFTL